MSGGAFLLAACSSSVVPPSSAPQPSTFAGSPVTTSTTYDVVFGQGSTTVAGSPVTTSTTYDVVFGQGSTTAPGSPVTTSTTNDVAFEQSSTTAATDRAFAPLDLAVGTCFDDPPDTVDLVTPDDIQTVDCESPHDNEVFGNFDIGGVAFPGTQPVQNQADNLCYSAFEGYVGIDHESSMYDFSWYFPTAESWPDGGTNVICFAYNADLSSITGSIDGIEQ